MARKIRRPRPAAKPKKVTTILDLALDIVAETQQGTTVNLKAMEIARLANNLDARSKQVLDPSIRRR